MGLKAEIKSGHTHQVSGPLILGAKGACWGAPRGGGAVPPVCDRASPSPDAGKVMGRWSAFALRRF